MDKFETIARIADWLALPLAYFILLLLFLLFVVRPFFSYLFDWNRINALNILQGQRNEEETTRKADSPPDLQETVEENEFIPTPPSEIKDSRQGMSNLAASDPEKAGNLVRQWLRKDRE